MACGTTKVIIAQDDGAVGGGSIIISPINCSRWVRAVSCRVAAHETDSFDDCVGGVGGVW